MLFRIALRNLVRNRRRTLLVLAAVALGITAVVGVRGFLNGLQSSLILGFAEGTIGALQVHKKGFLQSLEAAPLSPDIALAARDAAGKDILARIEAVDGVKAAAPRISFPGMINVGDETVFALFTAVDPGREAQTCPRRKDLVTLGPWLSSGPPAADALTQSLVGAELLRSLQGNVGDRAAVITNDVDGVMNAVDTKVSAELLAPTQGEKKLVLLPLAAGQELLRMPGRATEIAVRVDDLSHVDAVAARLREALGPDFEVHTWKQLAPFAQDVVSTQDTALSVITVIFLIVIMMGVANALLTSVLERVREIGTMMAVGARRRQILVMFVMEAALLGVLGAVVGGAAGSAVVGALAFHGVDLTTPGASVPQHLVPFIETSFLVRMLALSVVGASLAALWPAWRASRMKPVEALAGA